MNLFVIFADKWSPALQIRTVLLSIQALLSAPNPDDPLANDVAEKWKENEAGAIKMGEYLIPRPCRVKSCYGSRLILSTPVNCKLLSFVI